MAKKQPIKKTSNTPVEKTSFWQWLDTNILLIISGFLLAFIPLFPKVPLFEAIPGYIVRVRVEDILMLLASFVWLIQLLRKKIVWKSFLSYSILAYAIVGLLSTLSAIFITKTVPLEPLHVGKTVLHYFRYLEYFALFFITYSSIKTKADVRLLLKIVGLTVIGIGVYAVGQKYLYWPVYSTMNREFSKGLRLYLTEHARVQSTFGGHYDLAAYLVITTPLLMALLYQTKKKITLLVGWIAFILSLWMLTVSASRTSFFAFLASAGVVILLLSLKQTTKLAKVRFFLSKSATFAVVLFIVIANFGSDMYERLLQTLEAYPTLHKTYHSINGQRKDLVHMIAPDGFGSFFRFNVNKPENGISTEDLEVMVASDQQPETTRPSDVYVDVPNEVQVSTISADGSVQIITVEEPRTYSDNALRHGLSLAIRLDTLWPRAVAGFYRNPLLGSGYATLTKESTVQFTEAESTDNNYLRTLGETGLLGFITFYGSVLAAIVVSYKLFISKKDTFSWSLGAGFMAASLGLLLNAVYIDVFAASKVAFTFWAMTGILFSYYRLSKTGDKSLKKATSL